MDDTSAKVRSGAIITAAAVLFTGLLVYVGDVRRFARRTQPYTAHFSDLQFIGEGQSITVAGVRVGRVRRIVPPHASARRGLAQVELEVDSGLQLRDNAMLTLKRDGLLGERYLELHLGAAHTVTLEDDSVVVADLESAQSPLLEAIVNEQPTTVPWTQVRSVSQTEAEAGKGLYRITLKEPRARPIEAGGRIPDVPALTAWGPLGPKRIAWTEVRTVVASSRPLKPGEEIVQTAVDPTLADLGRQIESVRPQIEQSLRRLNAIVGNIQATLESGELRDVIAEANKAIQGLQRDTEEIKKEVVAALDQAEATLAEVRDLVKKSGPDVKATTEEMRKTAEGLQGRLDEVKAQLVGALQSAQGVVLKNQQAITRSLDNIEEATWYAKNFTRKLNENPAVLLFGADDKAEAEPKRDESIHRKDGRLPPYPREP